MIEINYLRRVLLPLIKNGKSFSGMTDNLNIMTIAVAFMEGSESIFVVLPTLNEAQKYYDALSDIFLDDCLFFPTDDLSTSEMIISSIEFRLERINTLNVLLECGKKLVITNINGALKYEMSKEKWKDNIIYAKKNNALDVDKLQTVLFNLGYQKNYTVEKVGDYSIRGNIIDVFPLNSQVPYRIDLFGDEIEEIKEFDLNTQKSTKEVDQIEIAPLSEMFFNDEEFKSFEVNLNSFIKNKRDKEIEYYKKDLEKLAKRENLDLMSKYLPFFGANNTLVDFKENKRIFLVNLMGLNEKAKKMIKDLYDFSVSVKVPSLNDLEYFMSFNKYLSSHKVTCLDTVVELQDTNQLFSKDAVNYGGNESLFISDLSRLDKTIIICLENEKRLEGMKEALTRTGIKFKLITDSKEITEKAIYLCLDNNAFQVELYKDDLIFLTEQNIYRNTPSVRRLRYKSVYGESKRLKSVEELKKGDYVVHYDYGIGIYLGLKTVQLADEKRDYIHIMYAGDDSIYVPLESIELIQRYSGREGYTPTLSTLGSSKWEKTKSRVKSKIKDISSKLIALYALRESASGFAFLPDTEEQSEFEDDFKFDETEDQLKAIMDVKRDMEKKRPMDRLICGDVGYGKTEVAMRGAFKAIMSGKQVAYLAPTTMLSRQQYYSFLNRFEKYGAKVALLNRFVSTKDQHRILKEVKMGLVDIVIGTHRILSKDLEFKDLGLLIIDEEQRFGVEHKERIKEMKVNVDTLTLTATPIPRTLQMSIMGIKDLSILNTPPKNRYPIQTYVLERNDLIVKEAISRELSRHGQVFYLYNKTASIERIADNIKKMVPEARVAFAHGKMNKYELEDIIEKFIEQEYDVLVCTTIIETGIDIPNTNTLIIHDADMLGLSQLYQIRGRVGRSDRIAYAYLMYDGEKILTEQSVKRLEAIKDFTELGSGYKIAMRDLSIRGAGDILGSEQSGFVDSVGIELYLKILEETIREQEGTKEENHQEVGKAMSSRHIPLTYINDDGVRIDIHKRIDSLKNIKELKNLQSELKDRFGDVDEKLNFYMYEKLFKHHAKILGATQIIDNKSNIVIEISEEASNKINGEKLFRYASDLKDLKIAYLKKKLILTFNTMNLLRPWPMVLAEYIENVIS